MTCIYCGDADAKMAESHIISNFIRKQITGIIGPKGNKTFRFQWVGRLDLPDQDLPKPHLLCEKHDNKFGQIIEGPAAKALIPQKGVFSKSTSIPRNWVKVDLPLNVGSLKAIAVAVHQASGQVEVDAVRRFAVLTAWRALHALRLDNNRDVIAFLASRDGEELHAETVKFLNLETTHADNSYKYFAQIYLTGPYHASFITNSDEDLPFAYAYLEKDGQSCIAVLLGFWIIIWPLLPDHHPKRDFKSLGQMVFVDWHQYMMRQYAKSGKQ